MSGEIEEKQSGWTVDTLHAHIQEMLDHQDEANSRRIKAASRALEERHEAQESRLNERQATHDKFLDERHATLLEMLNERYETQTKAIDKAFDSQQEAMKTAFAAADKAVDKALDSQRIAIDKALEAAEKAVVVRQEALDKEFHEHLEQVRHENHLALVNADKGVTAALHAQEKAVAKAEASNEKRFESVNEFRSQLADQQRTLITRSESDAQFGSLREKLDLITEAYSARLNDMQTRLDKNEGKSTGLNAGWGYLLAALSLFATLIAIGVAIFANID